jgi:hypothetical protein
VCYITAHTFRESDLVGGNWYATHIHFLSPLPGTSINLFRFQRRLQFIKYSYCEKVPVPVAARSAAARLLRFWVRIPPGAWMFVCCECCVLSGRGLCDRLITRQEESYRLWRAVMCDQETSRMRRLKPATGAVKIQP